jgi:hypothetical protein
VANPADLPLGVIEGYYGRPWSWEERAETMAFLAAEGFNFFTYAPKADAYLRRRWREPHPADAAEALRTFAVHCAGLGVTFGVGLSPFELYRDFNAEAKAALADKLAQLDDIGVERLTILFDDMRGDLPGLAASQADILHWIGARTRAKSLIVCPTYYSDDPALDRFFGVRPQSYLEDLGHALDRAIEVFWTGPEVCSVEIRPGHLERVATKLRRSPLLWDNYPVNDGPRMSAFLHLRAFTGRSAANAAWLSGHAVNPALQPVLSRIPAATLPDVYGLADDYDYRAAFERAALRVLGPELAVLVARRLAMFQDLGLDRLGDDAERMRTRLAAFEHPAAREILAWLNGAWRVTGDNIEGG